MRRIFYLVVLIGFFGVNAAYSQELKLEDYLKTFDYEARNDMKINSAQLVALLRQSQVQLVDIRFEEEFKAWHMPFAISIPLPDLPDHLHKLDKELLIVTACPAKDRAIIAMTYLKTQGYKVKYLNDGLLGLASYLRGDNALEFFQDTLDP